MGIRVMVEVMDHWADLGLTRGERDDLLVIAENVNDVSRETYRYGIYQEYMLRRAGKELGAWKNAVGALLRKGVLVYAVRAGVEQRAHRGRVAVYRVPVLCPEPPHDGLFGQCARLEMVIPEVTQSEAMGHPAHDPLAEERVMARMTQSEAMGHAPDDPIRGMGNAADVERVMRGITPSPPTPQKDSPPLPLEARCIRRFAQLPEREEEELIRWIKKTHAPNGPGWWRKLTDNRDLAVIIAAWRTQRTPTPPRSIPAPAQPEAPRAASGAPCASCGTPAEGNVIVGWRCFPCRQKQPINGHARLPPASPEPPHA